MVIKKIPIIKNGVLSTIDKLQLEQYADACDYGLGPRPKPVKTEMEVGREVFELLHPTSMAAAVKKVQSLKKDEKGKTPSGYVPTKNLQYIETVQIPAALNGAEAICETTRLRDQLFTITDVEETNEGIRVTADHVFYELQKNYTKYKSDNAVTGAAACVAVLNHMVSPDNRFAIYCNSDDTQKGLDYSRYNVVQALLDPENGILARYGLTLLRDDFDIYALKNVGTDRGYAIEYGKNMLSFQITKNIAETYTRIVPYGTDKSGNPLYMDGNGWVDSPHIGEYAAPRVLLLDCTDTAAVGKNMTAAQAKAELLRRANAEIANGCDIPQFSMTVDFLSLGDTEEFAQYRELDKVYLLDRVHVKDTVHGYNYQAEVVGVIHNLLTGQLESITLGTVENAQENKRKIASWKVPAVDGSNIRLKTITQNALSSGAVTTDTIADQAVSHAKLMLDAVEADNIKAGEVTAEKLAADVATLMQAKIEDAEITTAQIKDLSVAVMNAVEANIGTANINWAAITTLTAAMAEVAAAKIGTADIDFSHIKDLAADTAIITEGVGGKLYIAQLAVTEANMASLTVGELLVKGTDGGFYAVTVDAEGNLSTTRKQVGNDDVSDLSLNAGEKLIEGSVTAACLNAQNIFADSAVIRSLVAANLDVDTFFARAATVSALDAYILRTNTIEALKGQLDVWASEKIRLAVDGVQVGGRNLFPNSKKEYTHSGYGGNFVTASGLEPGIYTFSANGRTNNSAPGNDGRTHYVFLYNADWSFSRSLILSGSTDETKSVTFELKSTDGDTLYADSFYYPACENPTGTVTINWYKLEKGNKATDWSPAPEDVDGKISDLSAELAVQADAINLRVTQEEYNKLSIGGRNYLRSLGSPGVSMNVGRHGCTYDGAGTYLLTAAGTGDFCQAYSGAAEMDVGALAGKECVLRVADITGSNSALSPRVMVLLYNASGASVQEHVLTPSAPQKIFTAPATAKYAQLFLRMDQNKAQVSGDTLTVRGVKLESGNKPTDWSPAPEDPVSTVKNTAMTLDADGIAMSTTGYFRLYANDGKNSSIKLGGDASGANFSVSENGNLGAKTGDFSDGLTVRNQEVWTKGDILISSSPPTGVHGVIWLKPQAGVQQTTHSYANTSQPFLTHGVYYNYTLAAQSADVLAGGGSYVYTLTFRLTLGRDGAPATTYSAVCNLSDGTNTVTLSGASFVLSAWGSATVTLTATSNVNLCAVSRSLTAAVKVSAPSTGNTYLYIPKNTNILLTSKNTAASGSGSAQTCIVTYIP